LRRETYRSVVPSLPFIRSSATPRVSGIKKNHDELRHPHARKKCERADLECAAMTGKAPAISTLNIERVAPPME
jgi:hypothetical protein